MKYLKYVSVGTLVFASIVLTSVTTRTSKLSEGIYPGNLFPNIKNVENISGNKLNCTDLKGHKTLVVFWAAYNNESRKNNVLFANILKAKESPVQMVSICLDKNKSIFERTLVMDNINSHNEFITSNDNARYQIINRYKLDKGLKNYLINEKGVIIAMNITPHNLKHIL